jgi:hypothetical protein
MRCEVMNRIDAAAVDRTDGHASVQVQARHVGRVSAALVLFLTFDD